MLLDDNGIAGMDSVLAALDRHPNIEIRLFNPFVLRSPKMLGYLADFPRLNRRMHNKSFTAYTQATIFGGRNIGDEYFSARDRSKEHTSELQSLMRKSYDASSLKKQTKK